MNGISHSVSDVAVGRPWMLLPVALLGASFVGWFFMIRSAVNDPGFSIEPAYYQKAASFDQELERSRRGRSLGIVLSDLSFSEDGRSVSVQLKNRDGMPSTGALIRGSAAAISRSALRHPLHFQEVTPGYYEAHLGSQRNGLWEFSLEAQVHGGTLIESLRVERKVSP